MLLVLEQLRVVAGVPQGHKGKFILPINAQMVSLWTRDPAVDDTVLEYRMRINDPGGKLVAKDVGTADFENASRLRTTAGIEGIPFKENENGIYTFVIDYKHKGKWKNVANVPFELEVEFTPHSSETAS